jgi:hypothetical protein
MNDDNNSMKKCDIYDLDKFMLLFGIPIEYHSCGKCKKNKICIRLRCANYIESPKTIYTLPHSRSMYIRCDKNSYLCYDCNNENERLVWCDNCYL